VKKVTYIEKDNVYPEAKGVFLKPRGGSEK
jgi:hypothetical protein